MQNGIIPGLVLTPLTHQVHIDPGIRLLTSELLLAPS